MPTGRTCGDHILRTPCFVYFFGGDRNNRKLQSLIQRCSIPFDFIKGITVIFNEELKSIKCFNIGLAISAPDTAFILVVKKSRVVAGCKWTPGHSTSNSQIANIHDLHTAEIIQRFDRRCTRLIKVHDAAP